MSERSAFRDHGISIEFGWTTTGRTGLALRVLYANLDRLPTSFNSKAWSRERGTIPEGTHETDGCPQRKSEAIGSISWKDKKYPSR